MVNCADSSVQFAGRWKAFETEEYSRIANIAKIRYIAKRPTRRLNVSTKRT
jgi:hypothetical protein